MRPPLDGDGRVQTVARPLAGAPVQEPRGDGERPGDGLIAIKQQGQPRAAAGEGAARRQRVGRGGEALQRRRVERQDRHVVPELARRDSDGEARGRRRVDDERAGRCRGSRRKRRRPRHGRVDNRGGAARRTVEYAAFLKLPQASSTGTTTLPYNIRPPEEPRLRRARVHDF